MMQSPGSNSARSNKRMRLGTRSCTNCRKRKIRCIFAENSKVCGGCLRHQIPCIPQQATSPDQPLSEGDQDLKQRLLELEGMVRHICNAIDLDIADASMATFEVRVADALKNIPQRSTASISEADSARSDSPSVNSDAYSGAPLINLFNDSMIIWSSVEDEVGDRQEQSWSERVKSCLHSLQPLLPNAHDMEILLRMTIDYWGIWHIFPSSVMEAGDETERLASAQAYIGACLSSETPCLVGRAVLALAVCILQSSSEALALTDLPSSRWGLVDAYMSMSDQVLADTTTAPTLDGIECLVLQGQLFVDKGNPQKAWTSFRKALTSGLLLGLHRKSNINSDPQRAYLWSRVWQMDRQLSLIYGLPYGIPESHLNLRIFKGPSHEEIPARFFQELSLLAGDLNDRNQLNLDLNYSITLDLDQKLKTLKNLIPLEYWSITSGDNMPPAAFYGIQIMKMYYSIAEKNLHLPYMLKSVVNQKYLLSRNAAVAASRRILECYQAYRGPSGSAFLNCDLMDFNVFSGAITLVIDLLSRDEATDVAQLISDWDSIRSVTRTLKRVSIDIECNVAGQASQLLEYLASVHDGSYSGTEDYEAMIPYFGRIRIGHPNGSVSSSAQNSNSPTLNTIEFDANFVWDANSDHDFLGTEMGVDWTSSVPDQMTWDWNQTYEHGGQ